MVGKFRTETNRINVNDLQIVEVKVIDQCDISKWEELIQEYETPASICGYISFAVALVLANQYPISTFENIEEVEEMISSVTSLQNIRPLVESLMENLQIDRRNYVFLKNEVDGKFIDPQKKKAYMCNWVANYEIGDWISNFSPLTQNIHFLRCIERGKVEDEEYNRCVVEDFQFNDFKIFIESIPENQSESRGKESGTKRLSPFYAEKVLGHFNFDKSFTTQFTKTRLYRASEWIDATQNSRENAVFVVDGLGHFVVAKKIVVSGEPVIMVFNSMSSPISGKFMFTLLAKILLLQLSEETDTAFLHHD